MIDENGKEWTQYNMDETRLEPIMGYVQSPVGPIFTMVGMKTTVTNRFRPGWIEEKEEHFAPPRYDGDGLPGDTWEPRKRNWLIRLLDAVFP